MEAIDGKKAVVLVSTGLNIGDFTDHSYLDILKKTESAETPVYTISIAHMPMTLPDGSTTPVTLSDGSTTGGGVTSTRVLQADNAMNAFAEKSGGAAFTPRFSGDVPPLGRALSSQLRYPYSLGFIPTNRKADGKFHKLRVEVGPLDLNHDGKPDKIKVHHKQGYYAANK